jgi:hypothetical protein
VKRIWAIILLAAVGWSCEELGVDPRFAFDTVLAPQFVLPSGIASGTDTSFQARVWFDTASMAGQLRGAGQSGAEGDSSYVTRIELQSGTASWNLGNISAATVMVGADTLAFATLPDFAGSSFVFPDSTLRLAAGDLNAHPGDSVDVSLGLVLRNATSQEVPIVSRITIETVARARFQ